MTKETFEPVGLLEIARGRKKVDDFEDRLHSALDAKRDVASDYVEQLDSIADKEVEVKLDPLTKLIQDSFETETKKHDTVFMAGFEAGYEKGFWKGYNKIHSIASSEQRDRELLESHGIDVEPLFANVQKIIADHETGSTTSHEQDIDEDEPDQYPPEPEKWGGTK